MLKTSQKYGFITELLWFSNEIKNTFKNRSKNTSNIAGEESEKNFIICIFISKSTRDYFKVLYFSRLNQPGIDYGLFTDDYKRYLCSDGFETTLFD